MAGRSGMRCPLVYRLLVYIHTYRQHQIASMITDQTETKSTTVWIMPPTTQVGIHPLPLSATESIDDQAEMKSTAVEIPPPTTQDQIHGFFVSQTKIILNVLPYIKCNSIYLSRQRI